MVPDERKIKSYVWHGDECFFVSTIERDSSATMEAPASRFHETLAWEYNWETTERGAIVMQDGSGEAFAQHYRVCEHLFRCGNVAQDDE
jgi:hypothetical protein